jgi:aminomethyltransferase
MKLTALNKTHEDLGAKMASIAGYNMPIQYEGINAEHHTVRNSVGVFDVSHMGEFIIKGEGSLNLIQHVTTNDASVLKIGDIQYSCITNDGNGIVDDLLVYRIGEKEYMLVVNASNIQKDWTWLKSKNYHQVDMINISDQTCLLAIQGPKAIKTLQKITSINLSEIPYFKFVETELAGIENVFISATGYTGAGGFEIYFPNSEAISIWTKILEAGNEFGIKPIGLGARDTLRLEMGYCLYGTDINDATSPLEAGLGWITKFNKEFTSSLRLEVQKRKGVSRKLVGFVLKDIGIPTHDCEIVDELGNNIGFVTSGTQSPTLNKAIGMGYVNIEFSYEKTTIFIKIRNRNVSAFVTKTPFINSKVK